MLLLAFLFFIGAVYTCDGGGSLLGERNILFIQSWKGVESHVGNNLPVISIQNVYMMRKPEGKEKLEGAAFKMAGDKRSNRRSGVRIQRISLEGEKGQQVKWFGHSKDGWNGSSVSERKRDGRLRVFLSEVLELSGELSCLLFITGYRIHIKAK